MWWILRSNVWCLPILPDLQQQFKNVKAYNMIESLKCIFQAQARTDKYDVLIEPLECILRGGNPFGQHLNNVIGYVQSLETLGFPIGQELVKTCL